MDPNRVESFLELLDEYMQARVMYEQAKIAHDGGSWDWHGSVFVNRVEKVQKNIIKAFQDAVEETVRERLIVIQERETGCRKRGATK